MASRPGAKKPAKSDSQLGMRRSVNITAAQYYAIGWSVNIFYGTQTKIRANNPRITYVKYVSKSVLLLSILLQLVFSQIKVLVTIENATL